MQIINILMYSKYNDIHYMSKNITIKIQSYNIVILFILSLTENIKKNKNIIQNRGFDVKIYK